LRALADRATSTTKTPAYGNEDQSAYVDWLASFAEKIMSKLATDGSFVIDLGGAYQRGSPSRSLHIYKIVLRLCEDLGYHLCQEFYWHNTAKLPSPIEWVNKRKIRAKDSFNTILWLSKTPWPKADVRNVLTPYSARMRQLLAKAGTYMEIIWNHNGRSQAQLAARRRSQRQSVAVALTVI
jgi:site-specific DNA-methyltransferase (cytosine-N4-specific)